MDQQTWNQIDAIAEREAEALRRARSHRSVFYLHHQSKGIISREQAIFDEGLELHFTSCAFCGATFDPHVDIPKDEPQPKIRGGKRVSLFTQDIDICNACMYLTNRVLRSAPAKQSGPPVLVM